MTKARSAHLSAPGDADRTRCGMPILSEAWKGGALPIAEESTAATCCNCLRALRDAIVVGDEPEPFERHAAYSPVYGARELGRAGRGALERTSQGEAVASRGWPSPEAAVRSYIRARTEGASLRSTSDPDRAHRVQLSRSPGLGGREHAVIEQHRTIAVALDRAIAEETALSHACPPLSAVQCSDVYVLRIVGRPKLVHTRLGGRNLKGRYLDWAGMRGIDVVEHVQERAGVEITERHVTLIVRHFSGRVRDALVTSGEMRATVRSEQESEEDRARSRMWDPLRRLRGADA